VQMQGKEGRAESTRKRIMSDESASPCAVGVLRAGPAPCLWTRALVPPCSSRAEPLEVSKSSSWSLGGVLEPIRSFVRSFIIVIAATAIVGQPAPHPRAHCRVVESGRRERESRCRLTPNAAPAVLDNHPPCRRVPVGSFVVFFPLRRLTRCADSHLVSFSQPLALEREREREKGRNLESRIVLSRAVPVVAFAVTITPFALGCSAAPHMRRVAGVPKKPPRRRAQVVAAVVLPFVACRSFHLSSLCAASPLQALAAASQRTPASHRARRRFIKILPPLHRASPPLC
jgi:hypothetical protein